MNKASKTALVFSIVATLIFSVTSCGGTAQRLERDPGKEPAKNVTLTLWHQWVTEANPDNNSLKQAIKVWNRENPGVSIQAVAVNGEQYKTKIKTALAAGEVPDLFYIWGGSFITPYIKSGNILPLDSYLEDGTKDRLGAGMLKACTYNGESYALPVFTFIANLYCNRELFNKAGAKIPATYDELLGAVKKLRAAGITPIVVGEKDRWPGMYWYDILAMRQAGGQACRNALNSPMLFDNGEFTEAARKLSRLVKADAFNSNAFEMGFMEMMEEFKQGKAAMIYQGNWADANCEDSKSLIKGKVDIVPFPLLQDGKGTADEFFGGDVDGFCISMNTKYPEEAVKALKFICEKASRDGYLIGAGLPCWKTDGLDDTKLAPTARQSAELIRSGTTFVGWWDTIFSASDSEIHKDLVAELFAGKMTPEEFTAEMAKLKGAGDF